MCVCVCVRVCVCVDHCGGVVTGHMTTLWWSHDSHVTVTSIVHVTAYRAYHQYTEILDEMYF